MVAKNQDSELLAIIEPLCAVFRRYLKTERQKYTPERAQILDVIVRMGGVFEAEQLIRELKKSGFRVSKATVYRTLKLLVGSGIIQRVLVAEELSHYQLVHGTSARDLLVITDTLELVAIDAPELTELCEKICAERGLKLVGRRLQLFAERKKG